MESSFDTVSSTVVTYRLLQQRTKYCCQFSIQYVLKVVCKCNGLCFYFVQDILLPRMSGKVIKCDTSSESK